MLEHNNRKIADKHAEYVTGQQLRRYLADKVKKYVGENVSVFDGAAGSGQLEWYVQPSEFVAVEIQQAACDALSVNFPHATISTESFFNYKSDAMADCVVMNPPFSIAFKDLSDAEKANIQADFAWKKSGKVDDIFVLKGMKHSKRWGFFILFPGLCYRATEQKFRELIGNQIVELNFIQNGFDDTPIDVLFLVLDKQKTDVITHRELYDAKTNEIINSDTWQINSDNWERIQPPEPPAEVIDPFALEQKILQDIANQLMMQLSVSKMIVDVFGDNTMTGFNAFCDDICHKIQAEKYEVA